LISALNYALYHHRGQYRKNGEAYIVHPLNVYKKVKALGLSLEFQVASILHDVYEDCEVSLSEIESLFGEKIKFYIYCLSKVSKKSFTKDFNGQRHRIMKYIERLSMGFKREPLLMIVKMCDQLDNLHTIHVFNRKKQLRILHDLKNLYLPVYKKYEYLLSWHSKMIFRKMYLKLVKRIYDCLIAYKLIN